MQTNQHTTNPDRILSRSEFRELTGISRTSEWDLSRQGKLPPLVVIDGRKLGYLESAYNQWLQQHLTA